MNLPSVVVRGAGDLATGVAWRLFRCGFPVVVTELAHPLVIRRGVAFANAVFDGECIVEGVRARHLPDLARLEPLDFVPVLVDPAGQVLSATCPDVVVDARMTKQANDTRIDQARLVVGLGPGFTAGRDCHLVVETQRGHFLGRIHATGSALPDTGVPGRLGGHDRERVLRAPCDGVFHSEVELGATVVAATAVGRVDGQPVVSTIGGIVRGLLRGGTPVRAGLKVADVDPRPSDDVDLHVISDKARAIGGGVLEAIVGRWYGRV